MMAAAAETVNRDALWREKPALEPGCEHDLELLPIVEFRQSVVCANCGGLDVKASERLMREPLKMRTGPDGGIYMDGARLARRIRPA